MIVFATAVAVAGCGSGTEGAISTLGFGSGGTGCTLATPAQTFTANDPIRTVAEYSPALPAGTVVTIQLTRGGVVAEGYPSTVTLDVATACVSGSVSATPLSPGHYRLEVSIQTTPPSSVPPLSGEFDVS